MVRCYYDVLGVDRDADSDQLKRAYRQLALTWHPDKNIDNAAEAHKRFQEIQNAYETLMDAQERAWYDLHREQILKGADVESGDCYKTFDIFSYLSLSCFDGYDDGPKGFYTVYRYVFEEIAKEENSSSCEPLDIPSFGDSTSDYATHVKAFYSFWLHFSTTLTFAWIGAAEIRHAPDRRTKRWLVQNHRKAREKAIRERNDNIRNLTKVVHRKDPRVINFKKLELNEEAEKRAKQREVREQRRAKELERLRAERSKMHVEPQWMIDSEIPEEYFEEESIGNDNSEEHNTAFCDVCNKPFKNAKTLQNHFNSRKHKCALEALLAEMSLEEKALFISELESVANSETDKVRSTNAEDKQVQPDFEEVSNCLQMKDEQTNGHVSPPPNVEIRREDGPAQTVDKASRPKAGSRRRAKKQEEPKVEPEQKSTECKTCGQVFTSRNQLFLHLRQTKHEALRN